MSVIAAAYSSYTSLSLSQVSTAAADAGTKVSTASVYSRASSSAPDASVTTVSISYHAKLLLARASAEQSVVDQLQAQLDAFRTGGSAALRGSDANDALSGGMDLFEIITGASDDNIRVHASNATIDSGAGNDVIDVDGQANVVAGEGDDTVRTYGHSTVDGGAGNDHILTYDHSTATGGDGDDYISTYAYSNVSGGNGNDILTTYDNSTLDGGAGDDSLRAYDHANLSGGAGSDIIEAYDHAVVDAGTGDDSVHTYSHATVSAGDGADHVRTNDYSVVDGGAGDDVIQVGGSSTVTGGAGDDHIEVTGDHSTINFAKGDGNDIVRIDNGSDSVDFSISGYSQNDVIVTQRYGRTTVNFKGSDDSLVFNLGSNGSARLSFADHTSVDIRA
jgi:Ca2+-binding RTX toxin-like protein